MILVFDVGATNIRLALASDGMLDEVYRFPTVPTRAGFGDFLQALKAFVGSHTLEAAIGCFPAQFQGKHGTLYQATNIPAWDGLDAEEAIRRLLSCPVHLQNDVVLGGLGEAWAGAGSRDGVMAYFTVSTGVNAVRIVQGRIDQTIGHYDVGRQLLATSEGRWLTLEELTGGAALTARTGHKPREIRDDRTWDREEHYLAVGLYNTLVHWSPELVVFGGSMMKDIDLAGIKKSLLNFPQLSEKLPTLRKAKLHDTAGLHGALTWFYQLEGYSPT